MDKTRKLEFFKALNAKINFLEKVKFTGLESTHSRQVSIFFALIVQNTRQDTTLNVLLKIRVFSICGVFGLCALAFDIYVRIATSPLP